MSKIVLANIGGHVHLLVQGTFSKGRSLVKGYYVEESGLFNKVERFDKKHRDFTTIYRNCLVNGEWIYLQHKDLYSDLGHVLDTSTFKVGDVLTENNYKTFKGSIILITPVSTEVDVFFAEIN